MEEEGMVVEEVVAVIVELEKEDMGLLLSQLPFQ